MKKLLAILVVAGILIACNDNGGTEERNADSTRLHTDTIPLPADTVIKK
jgi:hypothetical protein